jgi:prolyl-tRNA synthetase
MKDSYSFDVDDAGLQASYDRHREAYIRTSTGSASTTSSSPR